MKRLLGHTAAAVLLAVAATMLFAAPASATRLVTSIEDTSPMFDCPDTEGCFLHGNAPETTAARSYCFIGSFDLIFNASAGNRFGFIDVAALVNKGQDTNCFNGGVATSVDDDTPLRMCANQNCPELSGLAFGDGLRGYCRRNDSAGNVWIAIFNQNGSRAGYTRATDLNLPPGATFPAC